MSRLATSRAGSAHYGRVKTSWLVDFPWLDVRFVLRDSITGRCSSRREGEAPCPGCVLCCRLFCKLCGHSSSTVFGGKSRGCKTIKRQALLLHNQLHPPTLENFRRIPKMLSEQDAYNHRRHMRLLFAVYHLATTHQALRRMPTMAKLAIQWNFRDKDGVREDLGRAYVGPDGARVFLFCIKSWQVVHYWNAPVPGWHQGWVKLKQSKKSNKFYGSYKVVYPGATRRQDRECYQELALGNYGAAGGGAQTWVIIQQRH